MKNWLGWLAMCFVVVLAGSYAWIHRRQVAIPETAVQSDSGPHYAEEDQASQMVTMTGPLADYMQRHKPGDLETLQPVAQPVSRKPLASDHVSAESPVGTSAALLHKTFNLAGIVDLPFDLPAHASTPNLRGTYRSFLPHSGGSYDDSQSAVEFLILTEAQFVDLLEGRPVEAVFSADAASNGEVDFTMPPTFGKTARYYLVFRNNSSAKKLVQADFRLDF